MPIKHWSCLNVYAQPVQLPWTPASHIQLLTQDHPSDPNKHALKVDMYTTELLIPTLHLLPQLPQTTLLSLSMSVKVNPPVNLKKFFFHIPNVICQSILSLFSNCIPNPILLSPLMLPIASTWHFSSDKFQHPPSSTSCPCYRLKGKEKEKAIGLIIYMSLPPLSPAAPLTSSSTFHPFLTVLQLFCLTHLSHFCPRPFASAILIVWVTLLPNICIACSLTSW